MHLKLQIAEHTYKKCKMQTACKFAFLYSATSFSMSFALSNKNRYYLQCALKILMAKDT